MQFSRVVSAALALALCLARHPAQAASVRLVVPEGVTTIKGILACTSLGLGPRFSQRSIT
jgi:hypothetical protein